MISDEECRLWHLARAKEPGALEVYIDWLLENDPKRGKLAQKAQGDFRVDDVWEYAKVWCRALGIHPIVELGCNPLPYCVFIDDSRIAELEPVLDRLSFLDVNLQCRETQTFAHPVFAKIRVLSIKAYSEEMDPDENYQSSLKTYYGATVVTALCASPNMRELEELWLYEQRVGAECAALVARGTFRQLRNLSISGEPIGDAGAAVLAESPVVATLRRLSLRECKIGDAGAIALASSPHFAQLEELDLWNNPIGAEGAGVLRARGFRELRVSE